MHPMLTLASPTAAPVAAPEPSSHDIAEELRTPLTVIHGVLRLLEAEAARQGTALGARELRLIAMASRNAERLATLIDSRLG